MKTLLLVLVVICSLAACKTGRHLSSIDAVRKDTAQFNQIGKEWFVANGRKIDTNKVVYIPGVKVPVIKIVHDTIKEKVPCDSFQRVTAGGDTVKVSAGGQLTLTGNSKDYHSNDSTVYFLFAQDLYNECSDQLQQCRESKQRLEDKNNVLQDQLDSANKQLKKNTIFQYAGYGIAILFLILLLVMVLKKII